MSTPFFRGLERIDGYAGSLCLSRIYSRDYVGGAQAFSCVEAARFLKAFEFPGTIPACGVYQSNDFVVVAVVGVENTTEGILSIVGSAQVSDPPFPGSVGVYWGAATIALWDSIKALVAANLGTRSLVLLGHSLGGMICELLYVLAVTDHPSTSIVVHTFGAAKPGDPVFASAVSAVVNRWETDGDPIPAIPPEFWASFDANWPVSGPPPLAHYVHPGQAVTVLADGAISDGSNPMSLLRAAATLASGDVSPHFATTYAARLALGLTPEELEPAVNGYEEPENLYPQLLFLLGGNPMSVTPPFPVLTGKFRVTLYYNYGQAGITESFWTTITPDNIRATVLPNYLIARMAFAVDEFTFNYARISDVTNPRLVDFVTPSSPGITPSGVLPTITGKKAFNRRGCPDAAALLYRMKLNGGPSARIFFHGWDSILDDQGNYNPNGDTTAALLAFLAMLQEGANGILYEASTPPAPTAKAKITAIVPNTPRGMTVTVAPAIPGTLAGTVVTIGGVPSAMQGVNGRKIVQTVTDPSGATLNLGGASPVGTYLGTGAYLYVNVPQFLAVKYAAIERVTSHRTGRPFGQYPGKKKAKIPLRR